MNTDDLNKLPRYIEAPSGGMWGPMPAGFAISNRDAIFVKLKDVEALFPSTVTVCEKTIMEDGVEYVSVGMGGDYLIDLAQRLGWRLYASGPKGPFGGPWSGNEESWEYFIKKEPEIPNA